MISDFAGKDCRMRLNTLVTGGAGYIGSHTCKALAEAGYNPIVLDDLIHPIHEVAALRREGDPFRW